MNTWVGIGRLTHDPELKETQSNRTIANFTIAINRTYRNQDGETEADFINIVAWDKLAENIGKYTKKGSQVAVEGRLQIRNYTNDEGRRVYITEIIASNVRFLDTKSNQSEPTSFKANDTTAFNNEPTPPENDLPW